MAERRREESRSWELSGANLCCLLQITVVQNSTEFTIRELFWVTEYCVSVEPRMANRPVPATRSDEQCVTTGHRDSKWHPGTGGITGCRPSLSLPALGVWGPCQGSLWVLCALRNPALPPHLLMSSLVGSAEILPDILSSFFITLLLLGLLGALLACTYIRKPVRTPSVLVRQGQCHATLWGHSTFGVQAQGGLREAGTEQR